MKTIWTVIGVIVLIAIVIFVYKKMSTKPMSMVNTPVVPSGIDPTKNLSTNTTSKIANPVVIQPVYINTSGVDCNSQSYQDGVLALFDTYRQKRVIYNNGINSNDPNTIQYHKDMNDAYNAYLTEADKCRFYVS